MEAYVGLGSGRLSAVTGVLVSEKFFHCITGTPAIVASSRFPCAATPRVQAADPVRAADFAPAIQEAYFGSREDVNDPKIHARVAATFGIDVRLD
jgi:protein-disulfide isomerase-like protein with CxxC motif